MPDRVYTQPRIVDRDLIYAVAGAAGADPRTVLKVIRGECKRGLSFERIRRVLRTRGIEVPGAQ